MIYGSVCSGIEAATVAWHPLGWRPAFFSEIAPFPRAVLQHHYPTVPLRGDFTEIQAGDHAAIDLLVGGTPCQPFSLMGLRGGLDDDRGNLVREYLRLADRLRPRWLVWENVPGVTSSISHAAPHPCPPPPPLDLGCDGAEVDTEDEYESQELHAFYCFLAGLSELGYGWAYRVLDAEYFGVAQRRRRVFVVGCAGGAWGRAAAVLLERESLRGNPPPSREAGKDAARCLTTGTGRRYDAETDDLIPVDAHAFDARQSDVIQYGPISGPLDTDGHTIGVRTGSRVRRLLPVECERLQGFPDGYTAIPWRGAPAPECPDGPRYAAIGNSMAVPVMAWIGRRIAAVEAL
jgi:DNA (cytosine-5)-methyltransferase 1